MWLFNSSIGRKVIMSVTGICLILFLTFHMSMNVVAILSEDGYNWICEMLGANWYAVVATLGLAALAVIHIVYASILTWQNGKARGNDDYAKKDKPGFMSFTGKVEWASQNMFALGLVVIVGLLIHLVNFWSHMMLQDLIDGDTAHSTDGVYWIRETFANPGLVVLYIVWVASLWYHLTHGFWSALQTLGWNGKTWFCRWKVISMAYTTVLCLGFLAVIVWFCICNLCGCC